MIPNPIVYAPISQISPSAPASGNHISTIANAIERIPLQMFIAAIRLKTKVDSGPYTSTGEVVREALRLLEQADRQEVEQVKGLRRA